MIPKITWHILEDTKVDLSPQRKTTGAMAFDLVTPVLINLFTKQRITIPLKLAVDIPQGYALVVGERSGLASKQGLQVLAGWIDEDYTGELAVVLYNSGHETIFFDPGDRIAQARLVKVHEVESVVTRDPINKQTNRGAGGFGSTGN